MFRRFETFASSAVNTYPENDPFARDPPLLNLSPMPLYVETFDTQEIRDAACAAANVSGVNPFYGSYGPCPLVICDYEIDKREIPFSGYTPPPSLERAVLPAPLMFLEAVNPEGNTVLFKVQVGEDVCLLKVYRDQEVSMHGYWKPEERPPHPMKRFAKEKEAYAHLLHYGACAKGIVPNCFGWLDLTAKDCDNLAKVPGLSLPWQRLYKDEGLPKALLLEYFDNAERLTIDNITIPLADAAVRTLYHVHAAFVLHNDIHGRNVLVLPGGRVVWIDFDRALTVNQSTVSRPVRRQDLLREFVECWEKLYNTMLMDKRIGFRHWLY